MLAPLLACPLVFGDPSVIEANEADREAVLNFVLDLGSTVVIDHSGGWSAPKPVAFRGIDLIDTATIAGAEVAHVFFDAEAEEVPCESGAYELQVDDAMGEDARIVSIVDGILLLEVDGELRYLAQKDASIPRWRVTWSSRYSMAPYLPKAAATVRPANRRHSPPRAKKR